MKRFILFTFFNNLFLVFLTTSSIQAEGIISLKLQSILRSVGRHEEIPVIIMLKDKMDLIQQINSKYKEKHIRRAEIIKTFKKISELSQERTKTFLKMRNVKKLKHFWIINGISATVTADFIPEIVVLPEVESVVLDIAIHAPEVIPSEITLPEWNIARVKASDLWSFGITGQEIIVANMDTGVDINHPDLNLRWRGGMNSWYDPNNEHPIEPYDVNGHGTSTMGVMVGGNSSGTAIGIAPEAKWIAVKIFNDAGEAYISRIIDGFQWLLDPDGNPDTDDVPDVVNNSWGFKIPNLCIDGIIQEIDFSPLYTAIQTLKSADISVVFSAGNSGPYYSTSVSPANYPESFSVGATNIDDLIAEFSSRGPSACDTSIFPDVVAPGEGIKIAYPPLGPSYPYTFASGTSFSAPHVAGGVALLKSAFSNATTSEIETAITMTAVDLGAAEPDNTYGNGLINLREAFFNLLPVHFDPDKHPNLFVAREGTGEGSVTTNGVTEINCGYDCAERYFKPMTVHLLATPGYGSSFSGWSGDCIGTGECSFDVSPDSFKIVKAKFTANTSVKIITPKAQEVIASGTEYNIKWEAPSTAVTFEVRCSPDNGLTWYLLGTTQYKMTLSWKPKPSGNRKNCLIKVIAFDSKGKKVGSAVSGLFRIEVVKLADPNSTPTPTIFTSGQTINIKWIINETKRPVSKVVLEYTKNGGQTWHIIDKLTGERLIEFNGSYLWKIPIVSGIKDKCKVRVRLKDSIGNEIGRDTSDNYFKIEPNPI